MKFMEKMAEKAKANPKSIAFPEATELKILQAARHLKDEGIAKPVTCWIKRSNSRGSKRGRSRHR